MGVLSGSFSAGFCKILSVREDEDNVYLRILDKALERDPAKSLEVTMLKITRIVTRLVGAEGPFTQNR